MCREGGAENSERVAGALRRAELRADRADRRVLPGAARARAHRRFARPL